MHTPFRQMIQGGIHLSKAPGLHHRLHLLPLIELEIQTYLLTDTSAFAAKIQDYFFGHNFFKPICQIIVKSLKKGLFTRASRTSVFGPCPG